ncbi:MAG: hypothetical protein OEW75_00755 [Cyclobacteriaceae bacterium]|nr:hypothetical protein [Cyclobacteriaceae bacterium]
MEINKSQKLINISLIISLLVLVIFDFWLSSFGQKTFLYKANLPPGITFEYDKLQGYKFLEEGFIHILDENTIYGDDTIMAILAYKANDSDVFVKSLSNTGKILYLNIHLLPSNDGLKYELIENNNNDKKGWIDVSNKERIRLFVTLRNILIGMIFVLSLITIIGLPRTFFRKT